MRIRAHMQAGHDRPFSEDRLLAADTVFAGGWMDRRLSDDEPVCLAIFDGVGGVEGGAYASAYAAHWMTQYPPVANADALRAYLKGVSNHLRERGGCATTASGLLFDGEDWLLFHIGNTRVWYQKDGYFEQLTVDQTMVAESLTPFTEDELARYGSVITGCLGGDQASLFNRLILRNVTDIMRSDVRLLFTCDGVHEHVDVYDLERLAPQDGGLENIVALAREHGSEDDCSVLFVERGL